MDDKTVISAAEINEAMKEEMLQVVAFTKVLDVMIPEIMISVDNVKDGTVLGHQIASVMLAKSIETLLVTLYAGGIEKLPDGLRDMFLKSAAKAYDDLAKTFGQNGTAAG
jgi:hypothetical protein